MLGGHDDMDNAEAESMVEHLYPGPRGTGNNTARGRSFGPNGPRSLHDLTVNQLEDAMQGLPIVDLKQIADELARSGNRVRVLWQEPGSLAFVARGREYRSEFHVNGSDEVTYMIKGTMNLHYRTPEGREEIAVIPEGSANWMPPNTEHSPRFPPDAFALIVERHRKEGETDQFRWYCQDCGNFLHEETFVVDDYTKDPVSQAYRNFFEDEDARTCRECGTVMPNALA